MTREPIQAASDRHAPPFEDTLDRVLHRPLAKVLVAGLAPLPVSANMLTLLRVLVGWAGAFFVYRAFFMPGATPGTVWILAASLLFVSMVLDCADGQLARARGGGTRTGRILDGVADVLVVVVFYAILSAGIYHDHGGRWFAVTAVAGFSMWAHTIVFDKMKPMMQPRTRADPVGVAAESLETIRAERAEARSRGTLLNGFLLSIYVGYLRVQSKLTPGSLHGPASSSHELRSPIPNRRVRIATGFMGLGTHVFVIYACVALMAIDHRFVLLAQVLLAVLFNALMILAVWGTRSTAVPRLLQEPA